MVEPLRHRRTKEAETDMFNLPPPRHISTLPASGARADMPGPPSQATFRTWLGCFLSKMTTVQLGEEHASPTEVWLSPNARDEPPSDPRGVIRIACKLYLKNSILRDSAIEQKRQAEDHNERGSEPRSECESACRYNQNPGGVSGMADEGVGSRGDDVLAAVGLDAND